MKTKSIIRALLRKAKECSKWYFVTIAIFTIMTTISPLLPIALPKLLIGEITKEQPQITNIVIIVGGFFLISSIVEFIAKKFQFKIDGDNIFIRLSWMGEAIAKMLHMDYRYYEMASFFEENNIAFSATNSGNMGIEEVYRCMGRLPYLIITVLALSIFIGIKSWLILLGIIIHTLVSVFVSVKAQKYQYSRRQDLGKANRKLEYYNKTCTDFSYGKDIRLYGFKNRLISNQNAQIKSFVSIWRAIKNKEYLLGLVSLVTMLISDVLIYGILINLTRNGMPIEDFSMYLAATLTLSLIMGELAATIQSFAKEFMYVKDFFRFYTKDYDQKRGNHKAFPKNESLEIEFKDVSFRYPNTDKDIVSHLNFKIPRGQRLALIGVNGAGKTTLVKLMTGLYQVDSGEILINGININEFSKDELYKMYSVVFQDFTIMAYTIAENVASASGDAIDRERVQQVLRTVGLRPKMEELEKGIDTMMLKIIEEDGIELSGGQNQKLAIAKALYKDANMVIMDEPTAALDALAEAEIYQDFAELVHGKTAVYISHRLASTKFCDQIALFDNSQLAEYGTHDELMALKGKYYEMFVTQGKYYQTQEKGEVA